MTPERAAPPRAAPFRLTRYFLAAGFVTAVLVAVATSTFTAREVYADLEDASEGYAVLIARSLNRHVHVRFVRPTVARDGFVDLDRPDHLAALDEVVRLTIAELGVRSVYFFDLEGAIQYSTNLEHRGFVVRENANYARAALGEVSTVLVERGSPLDVSGQAGHEPLLETYVPVERLDDEGRPTGQRSGVIEVYQDARELVAETRRARWRMAAISTVGIVVLMLVLWLRIRAAERTIDEQTAALLELTERLAALSRDLELQVEERTRALVRAETLATVGTLSAGVGHEINNPIAAIASCAEGLLRRARDDRLRAEPAFAEFPEYLEIIRDEAFRVKDITRSLLDFSRAGAGGPVQAAPVELGQLLQAAARLLAYRCQREQKRIELDLPQGGVVVEGDGASLRQLVLNVTVNALDASAAEGTVRWRLRAASGESPGAELTCEDDGKGMSKDELEHAFEPFFTRKPPGQGTGLGLSIAYAVARRHGGSILLESPGPGHGTRATIHLAASPPPCAQDAGPLGGAGEGPRRDERRGRGEGEGPSG